MRLLVAAILCISAQRAVAGAIVGAGVPFTAIELEDALHARGLSELDVEVLLLERTQVEIRAKDGRQRVDLGATRGIAAARLVALSLAGLPPLLRRGQRSP